MFGTFLILKSVIFVAKSWCLMMKTRVTLKGRFQHNPKLVVFSCFKILNTFMMMQSGFR